MNLIHKIMGLLLALVLIFVAGMGIMSHLDLSHSKDAVTQLRRQQIEESFKANFDRINAHTTLIERHVLEVASVAEIHQAQPGFGARRSGIETLLRKTITDFSEAAGVGVWFEPGAVDVTQSYYAPYAYWDREAKQADVTLQFSNATYDYPNQSWYRNAIEAFGRDGEAGDTLFWTPARYNPVIDDVVITVAAPIRIADGRLLGVATIDWRYSRIIELVSGVAVTPNSFAFLINDQNQKLSNLSKEQSLASQAILATLDLKMFEVPEGAEDGSVDQGSVMREKRLAIEDRDYAVYYAKARTGMLFGVSVPRDEMYGLIENMRTVNYRIFALTALVLVLLAAVILRYVAAIVNLLDTLYTDSITGLPNRLKLLENLKNRRNGALLLIDIDSFKQINDFYGQECGDTLLKQLGQRIRAFLAEHGGNKKKAESLYKMPADEFAVLLKKADEHYLAQWTEKLSDFLTAQTFAYDEHEILLGMTLGAALGDRSAPSESADSVISKANMALQVAKQTHKRSMIYDPSMRVREGYEQNLLWAHRLKKAIEDDRLVPYFQPIVNNATGRVEKFECLARLIDVDDKPVTPYFFLAVAKKLKIYDQITRTIVDKGLDIFQDLPYDLSINLSYEDIVHSETTDFIKQRLANQAISKRVVFEVLESESIDNYDDVHQFIMDVKSMDSHISIDDFGSGYSNFEHLLKLNADTIKIDGSLIRNIDKDKNAFILTQGIVNFARRLNLRTVAEFVSSEEILKKVLEIGIDYSQGYYFSMPVADVADCPKSFKMPAPLALKPA